MRLLMDGSGKVTSSYNYDPFGTPEGTSQPTDYGFTGEAHNATLGLVQLRARWYSTTSGRFQSHDPYAGTPTVPMSLHPYLYLY